MIEVFFYKTDENFFEGFLVRGHAEFSQAGKDIVCAGVSSCVSMCCNALTEILKEKVSISCEEGKISLKTKSKKKSVQDFLKALKLQISLIVREYSENVSLKILEV